MLVILGAHSQLAVLLTSISREDQVAKACLEEGLPWARLEANLCSPFPTSMTGAFVFVKNWIVRDQISVEFVVTFFLFLIPTSLVAISVNLFCHIQNVLLWLGKVYPFSEWKRVGRTNFLFILLTAAFPLQQCAFCHLDVSWSYAAFAICLTFHVLPN